MTNSKWPAFPNEANLMSGDSTAQGLTKREYFAAMAMHGFISSGEYVSSADIHIAKRSIEVADELLKQLNDGQD